MLHLRQIGETALASFLSACCALYMWGEVTLLSVYCVLSCVGDLGGWGAGESSVCVLIEGLKKHLFFSGLVPYFSEPGLLYWIVCVTHIHMLNSQGDGIWRWPWGGD